MTTLHILKNFALGKYPDGTKFIGRSTYGHIVKLKVMYADNQLRLYWKSEHEMTYFRSYEPFSITKFTMNNYTWKRLVKKKLTIQLNDCVKFRASFNASDWRAIVGYNKL